MKFADPKGKNFDAYVKALCSEIKLRTENESLSNRNITSLYFGGGTPSLLEKKDFERIFETLHSVFTFDKDIEITIEANPGTINKDKLVFFKNLGVNRLSLGIQTFEASLLQLMARGHSIKESLLAIELGLSVFKNISVDLLYGVPSQSLKDLEHTLQELLKFDELKHVSAYLLLLEDNSAMKKMEKIKKIFQTSDINEDLTADMYDLLCESLCKAGFEHYEISNFAKRAGGKDFRSKHNLAYWQGREYYGFGLGAHEFLGKFRVSNTGDLNEYLDAYSKKYNPNRSYSTVNRAFEELMLSLRLSSGLDLNAYEKKYSIDLFQTKKDFIDELVKADLARLNGKNLSLTRKGFLLSNEIINRLV